MNRKQLTRLALIPATAAFFLSVSSASAMMMGPNLTPDEIATQQTQMFQKQADLLGISVDEVKAAWAEGKDFRTLAKEKGITDATLKAKMQASMIDQKKAELAVLVSKGVITQAQSDARLAVITKQITDGKGKGRGMFGGHHHGMMDDESDL